MKLKAWWGVGALALIILVLSIYANETITDLKDNTTNSINSINNRFDYLINNKAFSEASSKTINSTVLVKIKLNNIT